MRLQSQLTLSHFAVTVISVAVMVLGGLIGYNIYLRSDFPAAWAGDVALGYADDIARSLEDRSLIDLAEVATYVDYQVLPVSQEASYDEWLIASDVSGIVIGSNHPGYPVGASLVDNRPPGVEASDLSANSVGGGFYVNIDSRHIGFAPIVTMQDEGIGWLYYYGGVEDVLFMQQQWARQAGIAAGLLVLIGVIVSAVAGLWMARRFGRKLGALETAANAFASGQRDYRVAATGDDEIGRLGQQFNAMADTIDLQIGDLRQLADSNSRLAVEAEGLARLEERNRLARDLHDAVKQQLFGMNLTLGSVQSLLDKKPALARERIDQVLAQTQDIQVELDQVINQLRPASLTDDGLVPALLHLSEQWSEQTGIEIEVLVQEARPLPIGVEETLYRVVQESLQNVGKHAQAATVVIEVVYERARISLSVRDDGIGFGIDSAEFVPGYGLNNMQERAAELDGSVSVESKPGSGTTVHVTLPLAQDTL